MKQKWSLQFIINNLNRVIYIRVFLIPYVTLLGTLPVKSHIMLHHATTVGPHHRHNLIVFIAALSLHQLQFTAQSNLAITVSDK